MQCCFYTPGGNVASSGNHAAHVLPTGSPRCKKQHQKELSEQSKTQNGTKF